MKNKKIVLVIIVSIFCILMGISSVKAETQSKTLLPNQYWGLGTYLQAGETLNFRVESTPVSINIYFMNDAQIESYQNDPQDLAIDYIHQWKGYFLLTYSFIASNEQQYWVLMINPSDSTNTYVVIDASIDEAPIPKTITIQSPTTNDVFDNGYNYIDWSTTGDISYVRIELYYSGSFLEVIELKESNYFSSYDWYLSSSDTHSEGSYYQIKISDYYDNSIYDYCDYFTIEIDEDYVDPYKSTEPDNNFLGWFIIILTAITVVVVVAVLVRKHKRKIPEEDIKPEIILIKTHCTECGTEILDKTRKFCSNCGTKIIK